MIIFEFLSKNHSHNQYLYGVIRKYKKNTEKIFVPKGCLVKQYSEIVALDEIRLKIQYSSNFELYFNFLLNFFRKKKIIVSGSSSYLIFFFSLFSFFNKVEFHLHGQFYGAHNNKIKRFIWKLISKFNNLNLCCPFYQDDINIKIDNEILILSNNAQSLVNRKNNYNIVGIISGKGRYFSKGLDQSNLLIQNGFKILNYKKSSNKKEEWLNYIKFLNSIDYLFLNPTNEYNHYSPSGTIFDSYNYNIKMISFKNNIYVNKLIRLGCKNIHLI